MERRLLVPQVQRLAALEVQRRRPAICAYRAMGEHPPALSRSTTVRSAPPANTKAKRQTPIAPHALQERRHPAALRRPSTTRLRTAMYARRVMATQALRTITALYVRSARSGVASQLQLAVCVRTGIMYPRRDRALARRAPRGPQPTAIVLRAITTRHRIVIDARRDTGGPSRVRPRTMTARSAPPGLTGPA